MASCFWEAPKCTATVKKSLFHFLEYRKFIQTFPVAAFNEWRQTCFYNHRCNIVLCGLHYIDFLPMDNRCGHSQLPARKNFWFCLLWGELIAHHHWSNFEASLVGLWTESEFQETEAQSATIFRPTWFFSVSFEAHQEPPRAAGFRMCGVVQPWILSSSVLAHRIPYGRRLAVGGSSANA